MNISHFGLRPRLFSLSLLGLAAAAVITLVGMHQLNKISYNMRDMNRLTTVLRSQADTDMMHDGLRGEVNTIMLLQDSDEIAKLKDEIQGHTEWMERSIKETQSNITKDDGVIFSKINDAMVESIAYVQLARLISEKVEAGEMDQAQEAFTQFMAAFDRLENVLGGVSDDITATNGRVVEAGRAEVQSLSMYFLELLAMTAVVLIGASIVIARSIMKPLTGAVGVLRTFASGDLRPRVEGIKVKELALLGDAMNTMADDLSGLIGQVRSSSSEVGHSSSEIARSSEHIADGFNRQVQQTMQVSAAVEQASASMKESTEQTSEADGRASNAGERAAQGAHVVDQTVEGMNLIREEVDECMVAIGELGKKGETISQIVQVINDIADQTNLLALNAAIEAARAGEHGRGFAVVADEVRKLAERTTCATEEVSKSIREIQTDTNNAVASMQRGQERVSNGIDLAQRAGSMLNEIVSDSQDMSQSLRSISASASEQTAAISEIAQFIEEINTVTQESNASINQNSTVADDLSSKSTQLVEIVERFVV